MTKTKKQKIKAKWTATWKQQRMSKKTCSGTARRKTVLSVVCSRPTSTRQCYPCCTHSTSAIVPNNKILLKHNSSSNKARLHCLVAHCASSNSAISKQPWHACSSCWNCQNVICRWSPCSRRNSTSFCFRRHRRSVVYSVCSWTCRAAALGDLS